MKTLREALSGSEYPGRGIVIGMHENGSQAVVLYFIMGRSVNSRNRIFVPEGTGLRTEAFDAALLKDPELIIYSPVKNVGANLVVTNGDQTDTVCKELIKRQAASNGELSFNQSIHVFDKAMRRRTYEPDAPNYTPRISGILHMAGGTMSYALSIVKADTDIMPASPAPKHPSCERFTFSYEKPYPGLGHFIHTYMDNGEPLPSFCGEPEHVKISGDIDEIADEAWEALNAENKVSLFVRFINIKGRKTRDRIVNKNR